MQGKISRNSLSLIVGGLLLMIMSGCTGTESGQSSVATKTPVNSEIESVIPAELVENQGRYQILRNGKPYFIKGAGGSHDLALLAASGGNSVRTWSTDDAQRILDAAHAQGLTVMLGLAMGKERHGFNYSDPHAVAQQKARLREEIIRFKDHPALLAWGIGNELDLFYTNTDVWFAVQDIAAMIQQLDPNHLVTTVTAGITQEKARLILERVPSIDYLSINVYGDLEGLPDKLLAIGYFGPYVVTEWGPTGHWEVAKTDWNVPIEQTSTQKAASYRHRYQVGILDAPERALGSYAFFWDQKQETTPTWYGVFNEQGNPTEVVDSLHYLWLGQWPEQRAPSILAFTLDGREAQDSIHLSGGETVLAKVDYQLHDEGLVALHWEVLPESTDIRSGGDKERRPVAVNGLFQDQDSSGNLTLTTPSEAGPYRLFVSVENAHGKVANANIPFYVDPQ